ncbi:hypothetical protein QOM21_02420 [Streptomyces sp. Pv4-95]|uniref:hypothetical protein n=1 Tax=Streptomyces sp. Pv4-95 TaxID=3049543 RepID=UPI003892B90C
MRRSFATVATVIAAACLALAACTAESSGSAQSPQRASSPTPATATPDTEAPLGPEEKFTLGSGSGKGSSNGNRRTSAPVPHLTGQRLPAARDEARAAGFRSIRTYDMHGEGRTPSSDRGWKVCTQTPGEFGRIGTDTTILLGVAKNDEGCYGDS